MAITATINTSSRTATINTSTSNTGPKQVSVTLPSAQLVNTLAALNDVDLSSLSDGALLQYESSTGKFVARTELATTEQGLLTFNGGVF